MSVSDSAVAFSAVRSGLFSDPELLAAQLNVCDTEQIQIPGAIQPHGYLIALDAEGHILQASSNLGELSGQPVEASLGQHVRSLIGPAGAEAVADVLAHSDIEDQPLYVGRVAWSTDNATTLMPDSGDGPESSARRARGERMLDMLMHSHAGVLFLEIEPTDHIGNVFSPIYALVRTFVRRLQDVRTVQKLCELAAQEVRAITGYGRVLVYRFDEEGNGHVLAEDRDASYDSYLHQRFPATDIPRQARALYLRHHIRLIVDANYTPAPLVPERHPLTGQATDLSFAALRSVSPIHLQYMRNMGTASSMSISIIVNGELWGLVSCHHHKPRAISFETRAACEHLGEVLSLQIEAKEDSAEAEYRLELRRMLVDLIATMTDREDFVGGLLSAPDALLRFMSAHGAAVVYEGRVASAGATPSEKQIRRLVDHIAQSSSREVFYTDSLLEHLKDADAQIIHGADVASDGSDAPSHEAEEAFAELASGVMAVQISRLHRHFVLWFRPEVIRTIEWAGDPRKTAPGAAPVTSVSGSADATVLSPRKSFETWRETVRNRSIKWRESEVAIAREFRIAVLGIVLRRAEEMAQLAAELGRVNKELEAFSYSVSHDLRAPLRHIVGYGDLLRDFEGERLSERGLRFLQNIGDSARFAGTLVDDLLTFSQMGRAALRPAPVKLTSLFKAVIKELEIENRGRKIQWELAELPTVTGDAAFLVLAIRNLLSNAVKYTKTRELAIIKIAATENVDNYEISISDNGVGFNMRYVNKLFGVFQRLHRAEDFEGTGIGLANVRRIIERHDGRTWAEGEPERGATFHFSMPKKFAAVAEENPRP